MQRQSVCQSVVMDANANCGCSWCGMGGLLCIYTQGGMARL